jgi:isopentenyl phosphate kinase
MQMDTLPPKGVWNMLWEDGLGGCSGVYVVKLGGSSITVKEKPFTPKLSLLESFASALSKLHREGCLAGIVVGGGSYGHFVANNMPQDVRAEAITAIHLAMMELVTLVEDILALHNIYTLPYPPHAVCRPKGLKPNCRWDILYDALKEGVIPLTYGDVYPCDKGYCIISGDELAMEMACALKARGVIYVTSVPGVLDRDGNIIGRLSLREVLSVVEVEGSPKGFDVTGGMRRKLEAIASNWCNSVRRVVIIGSNPSDLIRVARGERIGTEIVPD